MIQRNKMLGKWKKVVENEEVTSTVRDTKQSVRKITSDWLTRMGIT